MKKDAKLSELFELGAKAKKMRSEAARKNNDPAIEMIPLNHFIKKIHKIEDSLNLNTFKKWKEKGFKVKKGEKGFLFFSKPKQIKKKNVNKEEDEITFKRFLKCYLFTENQVEAIN